MRDGRINVITANTFLFFSFIMLVFSGIVFSLSITFLDVGHGDCIILETDNILAVIDTGDIKGGEVLREALIRRNKKIDYLFVTHPHPDHFYGVVKILDLIENGIIYHNGDVYEDEGYFAVLQAIKEASVEMQIIGKGDSFDFSGFRIEIIHPDEGFMQNSNDLNDRSLVMSVIKGKRRMLLTADITKDAQEYILRNTDHDTLKSEILKFPHHCSKKSFFMDFIHAVSPQIVIISTGPSVYNYPDEDCIRQIEEKAPVIARTDKEGSISLMW